MFITFEGTEGVGKTTAIQGLKKYLESRGYSVSVFREPGATKLGENIRNILLSVSDEKLCLSAEVLLFFAARVQNLEQNLQQNTDAKQVTIFDRGGDSLTAYQGYGRGFDLAKIKVINDLFIKQQPDITFWLDVPLDVAKSRTQKRGNPLDRIEQESNAFFERVRHGFSEIHKAEPDRVKRIDASQTEDRVLSDILSALERKMMFFE